jgi:hypothetical protein
MCKALFPFKKILDPIFLLVVEKLNMCVSIFTCTFHKSSFEYIMDPNKENIPPEDVWAAARRRLQEGQIWYQNPTTTPNPNAWKKK